MDQQRKPRVIITGATGFIGRNLSEALCADGLEVVGTGRNQEIGKELSGHGIRFKAADISSPEQLKEAFCSADCVVHCAAKAGDWGVFDEFYQANVIGTRNVIAACRHHNVHRVILISTPSVYVDGRDRFDILESEPLPTRQLTHYSSTKLAAEQELLSLANEGFEVIILRPRAVYGIHDKNFIPRIKRMAAKNRFPLIAGGKAIVDVTYVDNLVDLVRAALTAPSRAWNEVYNVSNGDPLPIAQWFERMVGVLGVPFRPKQVPELAAWSMAALMEAAIHLPFGPKQPLMTRFAVRYMARSMTLSTAKAAERLSYQPRFSTEGSFSDYFAFKRKISAVFQTKAHEQETELESRMNKDDPNATHCNRLAELYLRANCNRDLSLQASFSSGLAVINMEVGEHLFHAAHAVHGSYLFKLLDDAAFFACNTLITDVFVLTASFRVDFLHPVQRGELKALGRVIKPGRNLCFAESVVQDETGKDVARGSGVFARSKIELDERVGYRRD